MSSNPTEPPESPPGAFRPWRALAELLALTGLAITQPVLQVFGGAPDLFIHRRAGRVDIVAFALAVALLPPLALWIVELVVGRFWPQARYLLHLAFVGGLAVLFGLQLLKQLDVTSTARILALALAAGVAAVVAYWRWAFVRQWLSYLSVAPALFVLLFLTSSATAALLSSQEVEAADLATATDPASVVLLQFDEWPLQTLVDGDGDIDEELYPNLAALAGDGVWYRNATTAATYTSYAIPSILTGRMPDGERSPIASEYPENLFSALGGQFDLDVVESLTHLCPTNLCDGDLVDQDAVTTVVAPVARAPGGLGPLLDDARLTYGAMVDPDPLATSPAATFDDAVIVTEDGEERDVDLPPTMLSLESVDQLVDSIEAGEEPTLHSLHLLLPHTPYKFLPDGTRYSEDSGGLAGPLPQVPTGRSAEAAAVDFEEQRLLLQASYTDALVGRVLDRLRETGLYEAATVVVVADHGIGLEPGGAVRAPLGELTPRNYADLTYVPLIIKAPSLEQPGAVSDANVSTIDVFPTVLGALGLELPWAVDGIDLATATRSDPDKHVQVVTPAGPTAGGRSLSLDEVVTFDGEEVLAEVLARNVDVLLRDDNAEFRLYNVNNAGELVGRRVDDVPVRTEATAEAVLARPHDYAEVDLSSGVLPTHLVADLDGVSSGNAIVAVALNGRIAAVSRTWTTGDQPHHLEAMLVPDLLVDGENEVALYLVGGPEDHRRLTPVELRHDRP